MRRRLAPIFDAMVRTAIYGLCLALCSSGLALCSNGQTPDSHGEVVLSQPSYNGESATAPIPPKYHVRNEDPFGPGNCVPSSVLINGLYQGVPGLDVPGPGTSNVPGQWGKVPDAPGKGSKFWLEVLKVPGGYSPNRLTRLIDRVYGPPGQAPEDARYASIVGKDPTVLDTLSRKGYPIGATMNTGALYHYAPINHMVSLIHYRTGGMAFVVDNNDPGRYHGMPASEFARRWIDGGIGWAFIWTKLPPTLSNPEQQQNLVILGALVLLVVIRRRRQAALEAE